MGREQFEEKRGRSDWERHGVVPFVGLTPFMPDSVWFDRTWQSPDERSVRRRRRGTYRALVFLAGLVVVTAGGSLAVHQHVPPAVPAVVW